MVSSSTNRDYAIFFNATVMSSLVFAVRSSDLTDFSRELPSIDDMFDSIKKNNEKKFLKEFRESQAS